MKKPRLIARHGFTLVELLVVISACSVILTTSVALIHRVMQTHQRTKEFFDVERVAVRLSDQFRRDVHQATEALVNVDAMGEEPFLRLKLLNNQAIDYHHTDGRLRRMESREGMVTSREEFAFPDSVDLHIQETGSPRRVVLSLSTAPDRGRETGQRSPYPHHAPVLLQIDARLNRDAQVAQGETSQ